jgi:hypothetical protein
MHASPVNSSVRQVSALLRGEAKSVNEWIKQPRLGQFSLHALVIFVGAGLYGAAMGWWRAPEQALFVAIKFPLIILLTAVGNALLNAMLAPLLGLNMTFRQSLFAILMSFSIASAILGSFSPLTAFLVWNAPPMSPEALHSSVYSLIKLTYVVVIAFAGIAGNARLFQLLVQLGGGRNVAWRVLFAWLAGNLFLGSQLSWILRPFIGSPSLPVEFFRAAALHGNFYENVFHSLLQIFQQFD